MRLRDKVVIITGAASGQGAVEAKLFAKEGAKVVATDVQVDLLNSVVADINSNNGQAIAIKHDVTSSVEWKKVIAEAVKQFNKVDILLNNAGISGPLNQTIEDIDEETLQKVFDINTKGPYLGMKYVIPEMRKTGAGSIINISSLSGINGVGSPVYNTSKGGLRTLTKNVALDFAKENIRVNSIHPGTIYTPLISDIMEIEGVEEQTVAGIPINRLGTPEDVANAALFLASDESTFITGIELIVDGGVMLQ